MFENNDMSTNWYKRVKCAELHEIVKILDFPEIRQSEDFSCGAAALQSVLAYYGINIGEHDIQEKLGTNSKNGTNEVEIARLAKKIGFKVIIKQMNHNDLISFIDKQIPVIVLIQAWSDKENPNYDRSKKEGHFVVAKGYSKTGIYFEDPYVVHNGFLSYDDLDRRWHGNRTDHIGIAIFGPDPQYNPRYAEPIQ